MFLGHHGVDPQLAVLGDHLDGAVERLAFEALGSENLTDLLAFAFRREVDMAFLHATDLLVFLDLGLGARIIGGRHGEAVGQEIGNAEDNHHAGRKVGADHAGHDGEGGHRAVDAAIDQIAQIARFRPLLQALGDLARVMAVLEVTIQRSVPSRRS